MISSLISAYNVLSSDWVQLRSSCWKALQAPEAYKIAVQFCTEAAVLICVFPILDTIVPINGDLRSNLKKVTWGLVVTSEGLATLLLALAVIMSVRGERK